MNKIFKFALPALAIALVACDSINESKASEIATNFQAYKTIQEAYVVTENKMGFAEEIGYVMPTSPNFSYTANDNAIAAISSVNLGDCPMGSIWNLTGNLDATNGTISWTTTVTDPACEALTPEFKKLATK